MKRKNYLKCDKECPAYSHLEGGSIYLCRIFEKVEFDSRGKLKYDTAFIGPGQKCNFGLPDNFNFGDMGRRKILSIINNSNALEGSKLSLKDLK